MSSLPINELPTEILQKTLQYLQLLDLMRSRRVCSRWRDVVDSVVNEGYWHQLCRQDFPTIYKDARRKCHPSLPWRELYKSLHLWGKLELVDEEKWILICSYPEEDYGASMVSAIEGQLCVHEKCKIVYYDLKGEKIKEFNTDRKQILFRETESVLVYCIYAAPRQANALPAFEMVIVKKINREPDLGSKVVIGDVARFEIVADDVYYRHVFGDKILVAKAKDNYKSTLVGCFDSDVEAMGCRNDTLYVLLNTADIFALEKDQFVLKESGKNVWKFWKSKVSRLWSQFNTYFPNGGAGLVMPCIEIGDNDYIQVRACYFYGEITFLGGVDGILRLYNTEHLLANHRVAPICQFDIATRLIKPESPSETKIMGVDIIEKENGHIILVAIKKGVFAIELTHSSNRRSA